MKNWVVIIWLFITFSIWGQDKEHLSHSLPADSIERIQEYESFDLPANFKSEYRDKLRRARKVYPLALEAARVIDSLDAALEDIDRKGKQRKTARKTQQELKEQFKFLLKDLYVSDGKVLTKLIYRETGMTVREIIKKYRSGFQAGLYNGMAGIFDQDLDAVYLPNTDDFVLECVIQDLKNGVVDFDPTVNTLSKEEYKEKQMATKIRKKKNKKRVKTIKKQHRQKMREINKKGRQEMRERIRNGEPAYLPPSSEDSLRAKQSISTIFRNKN